MPTEKVIFGAVAYTDKDGAERWAKLGEEIDISPAESERLHDLGALFDEKAEADRLKAEIAEREAELARQEQARADETERLAGEKAAAEEKAKSQAAAAKSAAAKSG